MCIHPKQWKILPSGFNLKRDVQDKNLTWYMVVAPRAPGSLPFRAYGCSFYFIYIEKEILWYSWCLSFYPHMSLKWCLAAESVLSFLCRHCLFTTNVPWRHARTLTTKFMADTKPCNICWVHTGKGNIKTNTQRAQLLRW